LAQQLINHLLQRERFKEAEAVAGRLSAFAHSDDRSQAHLNILLGRIKEARGMLFEARRSYHMAAELLPDDSSVLFRLARMEEKMGNYDEATRLYQRLEKVGYRKQEIQERLEVIEHARQLSHQDTMWKTWIER
jgi:tetratricopeptide (TPR) repeat protein